MKLKIKNGEEPFIGGQGKNLQVFLLPVNDAQMVDRSGKEKIISMDCVKMGDKTLVLSVIKGTTFRMRNGSVTSFRYALSEELGGEFIACIQVTNMSRQNVLGNIYVHPDFRGKGIASSLLSKVVEERKNLVVDSSMTEAGAAFFGYSASKTQSIKP